MTTSALFASSIGLSVGGLLFAPNLGDCFATSIGATSFGHKKYLPAYRR